MIHQREQHETVVAPEVTKEVRAEMEPEKRDLLQGLKSQHQDSRTIGQTEHTASSVGAQVQEHEHHHVRPSLAALLLRSASSADPPPVSPPPSQVHEHITPVIQRDTHEHKTVHNVIPVHEKIHEAPVVHESTVLPTVSLDEFKNKVHGETHGSEGHSHKHFGGEPKTAPGQASEGTIGSHAGAATIDSKAGGHHHVDADRRV